MGTPLKLHSIDNGHCAATCAQELAITPLDQHELLLRFVLPQFTSMPRATQLRVGRYLRDHWKRLKLHAPLVTALKELPWVPVGQQHGRGHGTAAAKNLIHPGHPLLRRIFHGTCGVGGGCLAGQPAFKWLVDMTRFV